MTVDEKSEHFIALKQNSEFTHTSCISYFFDIFYERLFDVHPLCEPMFKSGMKAQVYTSCNLLLNFLQLLYYLGEISSENDIIVYQSFR